MDATWNVLPNTDSAERYVALLRGINVGGHRKIKMTDLVTMFRSMGHRDVQTLLASGNVVFSTDDNDRDVLTESIEGVLRVELGYEVKVILRAIDRLRMLVTSNPFSGYDEHEGHRYVTFYPHSITTNLDFPVLRPEERFSLLAVQDSDLFAIASPMPDGRHGDYSKFAANAFGKISTTRNWNTVVKIASM